MDKEVVNRLSNFKLRDKEEEGIVLELEDISLCKKEYEKNLIGKIWGIKTTNYSGLRNTLSRLWCYKGDLKVIELEHNYFQFIFSKKEEK